MIEYSGFLDDIDGGNNEADSESSLTFKNSGLERTYTDLHAASHLWLSLVLTILLSRH